MLEQMRLSTAHDYQSQAEGEFIQIALTIGMVGFDLSYNIK